MLAARFERAAALHPDRTAIVDTGGNRLSYGELDGLANRVARRLRGLGLEPGDRVGLAIPKTAASVACLLGILKARCAYVPVDRGAPATRSRAIFEDCGVRAVILEPARADLADAAGIAGAAGIAFEAAACEGLCAWDDVLAEAPSALDCEPAEAGDLAYVLYTSGSTGMPKGVPLTHANALAFVDWCLARFAPTPDDRFSSHAPFHFDLSILDLYASLLAGAELHLVDDELGKDPKRLAAFLEERALTIVYATPTVWTMLVEFGGLAMRDLAALRAVLFAGEVFPIKHLRRLAELTPGAELHNLYGPTETNVCTAYEVRPPIPEERERPYPIGPVCEHCTARVVDAEGRDVARGDEGRLWIAGSSVFEEYWNRPEKSAQVFSEHAGARWYDTGDLVRETDEGFVYVGRADRMVKRRGYRIELGEIESALHRHPALQRAAAVARDAPDGLRIEAHLVAAPGADAPGVLELKRFCAAELPASMSPDLFRFHDALPTTSTDKIDYQALLA